MLRIFSSILFTCVILTIVQSNGIASREEEQNLGSGCSDYVDTISIKIKSVPSLLNVHDQSRLKECVGNFIERKAPKFSLVNIALIRQMFEKERAENNRKILLLLLSIHGCFNDGSETENLQEIIHGKSKESFQQSILEEFRDDPFFVNITKIETVSNPKFFDEDEVEAITSYANIESMHENNAETNNIHEKYVHYIVKGIVLTAGITFVLVGFALKMRNRANENTLSLNSEIFGRSGYKDENLKKIDLQTSTEKKNVTTSISEEDSCSSTGSQSSTTDSQVAGMNDGKADTDTSALTNEVKYVRGECYAPPGKLGVAVDTVDGCPVVYKVKTGSPLYGILNNMDRIIGIDDVETSSMTSAEVTKLMVTRMKNARKITYERGGNFEKDSGEGICKSASM